MQCANCHFENMPGTARCARCGTPMDFALVAVDVHPPRARRWRKPFRRFFRVSEFTQSGIDSLRASAAALSSRRAAITQDWTLSFIGRLAIPGWSQFAMHRKIRGRLFLWGSIASLIPGILFFGGGWGSMGFFLLFSLHCASVIDALTIERRSVRSALGLGLLVYAVLGLLIYLPAWRLANLAVRPYALNNDFRPFSAGDVLLMNRLASPRIGDIVIYQRPEVRFPIAGAAHNAQYVLGGPGVDRILAIGGEHVQSTGGRLLVNGAERTCCSLNLPRLPDFQIDVPAGQCLIWPSVANLPMDLNPWQTAVLVPVSNIQGRVFFQTGPVSKWGPLR
jgi:hypothetical protein